MDAILLVYLVTGDFQCKFSFSLIFFGEILSKVLIIFSLSWLLPLNFLLYCVNIFKGYFF